VQRLIDPQTGPFCGPQFDNFCEAGQVHPAIEAVLS
jgi:hypothetical protein